jgi:hypothetical protein
VIDDEILDTLKKQLTPATLQQMSASIGADPATTSRANSMALPALARMGKSVEKGLAMHLVECKSGATFQPAFTEPLKQARSLLEERLKDSEITAALVYGGEQSSIGRDVGIYG